MQDFPDVFGIIDFYLSICRTHIVRGVVPDGFKVRDLGKIEILN